jgi:hypothetical protein
VAHVTIQTSDPSTLFHDRTLIVSCRILQFPVPLRAPRCLHDARKIRSRFVS